MTIAANPSGSGDALLEGQSLGRRHPAASGWLLQEVSLRIEAGSRWAISGPSGSGKTLLLRALALLDPVDAGDVLWQGRPVRHDEVPLFRSQAIYVHQRPALLEESVEAALQQPLRLRVHRRRAYCRARVLELLAALGRDAEFLEKNVRDLSGGEMQIVGLVRAIQLNPRVMLLDEPTAALDPATAGRLEQLMLRWVSEGSEPRAMVWVTHDVEQAGRVASHTARIEAGRLVA